MATFTFTRKQLLQEADRYLAKAAALPDSDPAKPQWIKAASDLSNAVLARLYNSIAALDTSGAVPDDLEH